MGGEFWSDVYFATSVGKNINEAVIQKYVKQQGTQDEYKQLYMKVWSSKKENTPLQAK